MSFRIRQTIPILRIFDVDKAREFYLDYLGFQLEFEHRYHDNAPLFMEVRRGDCSLMLSEHHGDGTPGTVVFLRTSGLAEFHAELSAKNYRYLRPGLESSPSGDGATGLEVIDPFGNHLRFDEELDEDETAAQA